CGACSSGNRNKIICDYRIIGKRCWCGSRLTHRWHGEIAAGEGLLGTVAAPPPPRPRRHRVGIGPQPQVSEDLLDDVGLINKTKRFCGT
ncbi:MAG: hypothetical protein V3S25_10795, partial [Nitrospirales bacterium]